MNTSRFNLKLTLYFCAISTVLMLIFYATAYLLTRPSHMALAKQEISIIKNLNLGRIGIVNKIDNSEFVKKIYVITPPIDYNRDEYDYYGEEESNKKFYALILTCYAEERPFLVVFNESNQVYTIKFLSNKEFMKQNSKLFLDHYLKDIKTYKQSFLNSLIFNIINPYSYAIYQANTYLQTLNKEELL